MTKPKSKIPIQNDTGEDDDLTPLSLVIKKKKKKISSRSNKSIESNNKKIPKKRDIKQQSKTPSSKKKKPVKKKTRSEKNCDDEIPVVTLSAMIIKERENAQCKDGENETKMVLYRVPSIPHQNVIYESAAELLASKESQAFPSHGGRSWSCFIKISDSHGAQGYSNDVRPYSKHTSVKQAKEKKNPTPSSSKTNSDNGSKGLPLFRWYRNRLELACLPHLLEQIDSVEGSYLDFLQHVSSSNDVDEEDEQLIRTSVDASREITLISKVAFEKYSTPPIERIWKSPDLLSFRTRKKTVKRALMLFGRDKLMDRVLYGYGHQGVELKPVKPTKEDALEAGYARFLRDGLWVVGQKEAWLPDRVFAWSTGKRLVAHRVLGNHEKSDKNEISNEEENDDDDSENDDSFGNCNVQISSDNLKKCSNMDEEANTSSQSSTTTSIEEKKEDGESQIDGSSKTINLPSRVSLVKGGTVEEPEEDNLVSRPIYEFTPSQHGRLTQEQIVLCYNAALEHYDRVMYTVKARGLYSELDDGFDVFRERGRGRYDMELPIFDTPQFDFLTNIETAAWMPIVNKIFNYQSVSLVHKGIFLSMPDSAIQVYHQDGVHLTTKYQKACHAINVFIPLVGLHAKNGPTEFCVGTHYLGHENYCKELVEIPLVDAGTPIIFDYRLGHRGMGNSSSECRPILYLTYTTTANEFRDSVNFSRKRYRKIGRLLETPLSRNERALKRRLNVQET